MSFPKTKGKLSQNVLTMNLTLYVQLLCLFSLHIMLQDLGAHKYELCLKVTLAKKAKLHFKAEMK